MIRSRRWRRSAGQRETLTADVQDHWKQGKVKEGQAGGNRVSK